MPARVKGFSWLALLLLWPTHLFAAPVITNLAVTAMTSSTVTVQWTTDVAATTQLLYGVGSTNASTPVVAALVTAHTVTLQGVYAGVVWSYAAVSQDNTAASTTSATQQFQLCNPSTGGNVNLAGTINNYYEYGLYTITWTNQSGQSVSPTICGQALSTPLSGTLDGASSLSLNLPSTLQIVPSPSNWSMAVTGINGSIGSFTASFATNAASNNISSVLQTAAAALGVTKLVHVWCATNGSVCYPAGSGGATTPATTNVLRGNGTANGVVAAAPGSDYLEPSLTTSQTMQGALVAPSFVGPLTGNASTATNMPYTGLTGSVPTWNQNTTGTAAGLSGTPALPNGTTATTQTAGDNSTKPATTAFVMSNAAMQPTVADAPGDLLCAMAADTTIHVLTTTGGSSTGTVVTLSVSPTDADYMVPGQLFGITGSSVTGLNGGPYAITSAGAGAIVFSNSSVASGSIAPGGFVYRWCENQASDAITSATGFSINKYAIAANTLIANQTLDVRAQVALATSSSAAGVQVGFTYGGTTLAQTFNPVTPAGSLAYVSGQVSVNLVDFVIGSAGLLNTTFQALSLPSANTGLTIYNSFAQPRSVNTTAASNLQMTVTYVATGVASGTYTSGITATGTTGQTCTLTSFNNSSTATATVALTGTNTIAASTALVITARGQSASAAPTTATAGNGTATCSGTATIATVLGGAPGNAFDLTSLVVRE